MVFTCLQYKSFENTAGKGEIARNKQFLLFPQCFLPILEKFLLLLSTSKLLSEKLFQFRRVENLLLWKGLWMQAMSPVVYAKEDGLRSHCREHAFDLILHLNCLYSACIFLWSENLNYSSWDEASFYYAPASIDRGHIVFGLSVYSFACASMCLSAKTFTLAISFDWYNWGPSYFTWEYLVTRSFCRYQVQGHQSRSRSNIKVTVFECPLQGH